MLKRSLFSLVAVVLVAVSLNAYQSDWVTLAPEGAGFSVMLPGKPDEQTNRSDNFTQHLFTLKTAKTIFLATYGDYSPNIKLNPEAELIANRDNFLKSLGATLLDSNKISLDGRAGLEFTGVNSQARFKSRVYLSGNRVHMIVVAVFTGQDDPDNVNRFFASFSFLSKPDHLKP